MEDSKQSIIFEFFFFAVFSLTLQILYFRLTLHLFHSSEFIISFFYFSWFFGQIIGLIFPLFKKPAQLPYLYTILIVISLIIFNILFLLKLNFITGFTLYALLKTSLIIFLVLSGTSYLIGIIFRIYFSAFTDKNRLHILYLIESTGFIAAGISLYYINPYLIDFRVLLVISIILNIIQFFKYRKIVLLLFISICMIGIFFGYDMVEKYTYSKLYPSLYHSKTIKTNFGRLDIFTDKNESFMFFKGMPFLTETTPEINEEIVFLNILQFDTNPRILIQDSLFLRLDKSLLNQYTHISDIFTVDKTMFNNISSILYKDKKYEANNLYDIFNQQTRKYDIILFDMNNPDMLNNTRYYFNQFIIQLKNCLSDKGHICFIFNGDGVLTTNESALLKGIVYNTLKKHFRYLEYFPLNNTYLLVSNHGLIRNYSEFLQVMTDRNISTTFFNYINVALRLQNKNNIEFYKVYKYKYINSYHSPIILLSGMVSLISEYSRTVSLKMQKYGLILIKYRYILYILVLLAMILFIRYSKNAVIPGSVIIGIQGLGLQILNIFIYQIHYGIVYNTFGIITSLFMAGLGSGLILRRWLKQNYLYLIVLIISSILTLIFMLIYQSVILILLPIFLNGLCNGFLFRLLAERYKQDIKIYIFDLVGTLTASILITLVFIPFLGFYYIIGLILFNNSMLFFLKLRA